MSDNTMPPDGRETPSMPTTVAEWDAHWAVYRHTVAQRDAAWAEVVAATDGKLSAPLYRELLRLRAEVVPVEDREQVYDLLESAEVFGPSALADFHRLLRLPEKRT